MYGCVTRENGSQALSITNYGKKEATLTMSLKGAINGTKCVDLINGIQIPSKVTLKPYEVLFVEVSDGDDMVAYLSSKLATLDAVFISYSLY